MKLKIGIIFLFFLTILCISCHSKSGRLGVQPDVGLLKGRVIKIIDGDTYDIILTGNQTERIRMEGIDAPEKGMPFYQVSKKYLGELCFNKIVTKYIWEIRYPSSQHCLSMENTRFFAKWASL